LVIYILGNHHIIEDDNLLKNNNIHTVINCTRNNYNINKNLVNIIDFPSCDPHTDDEFLFIIHNINKILQLIDKLINENKKIIIFVIEESIDL